MQRLSNKTTGLLNNSLIALRGKMTVKNTLVLFREQQPPFREQTIEVIGTGGIKP